MNKIVLAPIFQSHMVLQRQKPVQIWGQAPAGSCVQIHLYADSADNDNTSKTHFGTNGTVKAITDSDGCFHGILPPQEAARNYILSISCNVPNVIELVLTDISIGDVWLACGQSNMEFFLRYDKDWEQTKQLPKNPDIHVYNVVQTAFEGHERKTPGYGRWMDDGDLELETFSAPGYSFARYIQPHIGVPIGIIGCNWGGTTATAWLDESELKKEPLNVYLEEYETALSLYSPKEMQRISLNAWEFEDSPEHGADFAPLMYGRDYKWQQQYLKEHTSDPVIPMGPYNINRPGGLYHRMLEPLTRFSIKGVLWYQGESDAYHADMYDILLGTLIQSWRRKWNDNFPFLFVQLAPFGVWLECTSDHYTLVREKQELVSHTVPNTGMVSIMDIGSYYDIHPKEKMEVGRRLALLARGKVYGEDILCESPCILSTARKGQDIILIFDHCKELHTGSGQNDFMLQQNNTILTLDSMTLTQNTITLSSSALSDEPVEVSLGFADYAQIHIYNEAELPILPFSLVID